MMFDRQLTYGPFTFTFDSGSITQGIADDGEHKTMTIDLDMRLIEVRLTMDEYTRMGDAFVEKYGEIIRIVEHSEMPAIVKVGDNESE
jgi:hypothetical protein